MVLVLASRASADCVKSPPTIADDPCLPNLFYVPYQPTASQSNPSNWIYVTDGTALQNALNNAAGGTVIALTPGGTYYPPAGSESFILPEISSATKDNWIIVRSSSTVFDPTGSIPPNTRVDISSGTLAQMPKILTHGTQPSSDAMLTAARAHHFRFIGIEFASDSGQSVTNLIELGSASETNSDNQAHDIVLDRCYIHGADSGDYLRGVAFNGARLAVIESYIANFHKSGAQAQGIGSWNGPGPFKIVNNYIEADGENVMFGGADPKTLNLVASDIEVRKNYMTKNLSHPASGSCNAFESKNSQYMLVEGNVFENVRNGCQDGTAILFKSVNQDGQCTWCITQHITFRNNIVRKAGGAISIAATVLNNGYIGLDLNHVLVENVVTDDIGQTFAGTQRFLLVQAMTGHTAAYLRFRHNTAHAHSGNIIGFNDDTADKAPNFTWTANLVERKCYGINQGGHEGSWSFVNGQSPTRPFDPSTYGVNALVNTSASCSDPTRAVSDTTLHDTYPNISPSITFIASNWADTGIDTTTTVSVVGTTTPTFTLASSSPYHNGNANSPGDGKDMGADTVAMMAAFTGPGGSQADPNGGGCTSNCGGPLTGQDIGAVGMTGNTSQSNGVFTVTGSGADIWGAADAFQFAYQPMTGDGTIIARVTGIQNTSSFAKAGIMIRGSLNPDAAHVILDLRPTYDVEFMTRTNATGQTTFLATAVQAPPTWLKLVRSGSTVTAYVSSDGANWTSLGYTSPNIPATAYWGLAVTSHNNSATNQSTFDNVSITPALQNIVVYASDLPASALHGSWSKAADATAAGGTTLSTTDLGVSNTTAPLPAPIDYVDVRFNAPAGTPYTLWMRLKATANSKFNDSVYVQFSDALVSGAAAYQLSTTNGLIVNLATDSTASSLNNWGWVNGAYWLSQATTISFAAAGDHTMRIQVREDGVKIDQIVLSPVQYFNASASCPTTCTGAPGGVTNDTTIVAKPVLGGQPYTTAFAVPGTFQAEDFDNGGEGTAYHDNTPGNQSGQYRTTDVDIVTPTGGSGYSGYAINNFETGEWLTYTMNVSSAGSHDISLNVSSEVSNSSFHIEIDGIDVSGTVTVPDTGYWGTFQAVTVPGVTLSAGSHVLRVISDQQYFNFDAVIVN